MVNNSDLEQLIDRALAGNLGPITQVPGTRPARWDEVRHAPLRDAATNELICICLELARLVAVHSPGVIYRDTAEPFWKYSVDRLNHLFHCGIQVKMTPVTQPEPDADPRVTQESVVDTITAELPAAG